ncbi:MAG TPA: DUF2203 domain-containing protein [Gemmatimonadaceae bacterium]|nr:DUF2203 domain-containing protein [Gemmatimonadaceae bacterium]
MPPTYTVEQANRSLPLVRRIVEDVVSQYRRWQDRVRELETLNAVRTAADDIPRATELEAEIHALAVEIEGFRRELRDLGLEVKDYSRGLVDFPAVIGGREVFLCWRIGEPAVQFWHDKDAGFAGRRPIPLRPDAA